jgi:hypothetical protein
MFIVNRSEQGVQYYWTGANWTTDKSQSKPFESWDNANKEMKQVRIKYTWRTESA